MPVIGEGSDFVALLPGALEALVSNIKSGFAALSHTHGPSGIEDGAITTAKVANGAITEGKLDATLTARIGAGGTPAPAVENLSPWFAIPTSSKAVYEYTGYDGSTSTYFSTAKGYWHTLPGQSYSSVHPYAYGYARNGGLTESLMGEWGQLYLNNETNDEVSFVFAPARCSNIQASQAHTLLVEWSGMTFTAPSYYDSSLGQMVTLESPGSQATLSLDKNGGDKSTLYMFEDSAETATATGSSGSARLHATAKSSMGQTSNGYFTYDMERLIGLVVTVPARTRVSGYLRVGLYAGEYTGGHVAAAPCRWYGGISGSAMADDSLVGDKLADYAVTTAKLAEYGVTTTKIANGAVDAVKIATGAVTTIKLASGAVTSEKLSSESVGTSAIADGAVTSDKLSDEVQDLLGAGGGSGLSESDLYDVLYSDSTGTNGTISLAKAVTGYGAQAYKRIVIYHYAQAESGSNRHYGSTTIEMTSTVQNSERYVELVTPMCDDSELYLYHLEGLLASSSLSFYSKTIHTLNATNGKVTYKAQGTSTPAMLVTRVEGWKV